MHFLICATFYLAMKQFTTVVLLIAFVTSCGDKESAKTFTEDVYESHIKILASDDFQGRLPFTEGEKKTIAYVEEQFKAVGLEPGNGTSFQQEVPMVEITATADPEIMVDGKKPFLLKGREDYVIWTERTEEAIDLVKAEMVFAGFGIVAPEYNWNDYAGLDVKGKVVLVLVNDPGFGGEDSTFFKGNTMTYYGRWTYKFEEAARQGAKGCLVIHHPVAAGYAFNVPQNNWNTPHLYLDRRDNPEYKCEMVGWLSQQSTQNLFELGGFNFGEQQSTARKPGFKGFSIGQHMTVGMTVKSVYNKTYNLIGKITGSTSPDEYVLYSAHWDHVGVGRADKDGDTIYNGAEDNASGTAGLIELARLFKSQEEAPARTILFVAVTAEEQGLQGSAYYAQHPVYPAEKTVADINIDGLGSYGLMKDIVVIGKDQSDLEDYLRDEAAKVGRYVADDPHPEAGYYFRSDHFNFAKVGIPALFTGTGVDHAEKGREYGLQLQEAFITNHYHQPSDEYDETKWNSDGALADLTLLYNIGKRLAYGTEWPKWKEVSEFKSKR